MRTRWAKFLDWMLGKKCPHGVRSSDWIDHMFHASCREQIIDFLSRFE